MIHDFYSYIWPINPSGSKVPLESPPPFSLCKIRIPHVVISGHYTTQILVKILSESDGTFAAEPWLHVIRRSHRYFDGRLSKYNSRSRRSIHLCCIVWMKESVNFVFIQNPVYRHFYSNDGKGKQLGLWGSSMVCGEACCGFPFRKMEQVLTLMKAYHLDKALFLNSMQTKGGLKWSQILNLCCSRSVYQILNLQTLSSLQWQEKTVNENAYNMPNMCAHLPPLFMRSDSRGRCD